jgi:hypothetical protein
MTREGKQRLMFTHIQGVVCAILSIIHPADEHSCCLCIICLCLCMYICMGVWVYVCMRVFVRV